MPASQYGHEKRQISAPPVSTRTKPHIIPIGLNLERYCHRILWPRSDFWQRQATRYLRCCERARRRSAKRDGQLSRRALGIDTSQRSLVGNQRRASPTTQELACSL